MSIVSRQPTNDYNVTQAENLVNHAYYGGEEQGVYEGIVGEHEDFGSWFTSGLSGLFLSQALPEDQEKELFIKRTSANYGMAKLDETIEAFRQLNEVRGLTPDELSTVKELVKRKGVLVDDLAYVNDNFNGDLDAPMDVEGNSFTDRWSVGDDEAGILEFIDGVKKNPKYATGIVIGEILKDAPLSVLAWLGLTAKTAKGASAFATVVNKLNNIQPKALRGLAKVATPVGMGAIGGGAYEAGYSKLNEGKVKWKDVEAGTEFGAAFGILGTLGVFAKGVIPEQAVKAGTKISKAGKDTPMGDMSVSDAVDTLVDKAERERITKFSESLMAEHDKRLFPQLTAANYTIMNRAEAKQAGISLADKDGKGAFNRYQDGKNTIIWGEKETEATFKRLQQELNSKELSEVGKGTLAGTSINDLKYLQDKSTYDVFQLAHEKAHVIQNVEGRTFSAHPNDALFKRPGSYNKELEANQMAFEELNRTFKEQQVASADKSAVAADKQIGMYNEGKEYFPPDYDEKLRGLKQEETVPPQLPNSQIIDFLEKHKAGTSLAAALAAYSLSGEEDAKYIAATAALATLAGPKAYRKLNEVQVSQELAKARLQAAKAHEGLSVYAKNVEVLGQSLGDRITKRFPGDRGTIFLEAIEKGKTFDDVEGKSLVKQWNDWMGFLARQGTEVGLFQGKHGIRRGKLNLVANYVSHIVRGKVNPDGSVRPLTNKEKEDLIRSQADKLHISGSTNTAHEIPRKIMGTLEDLKAKGYAVVDDPAQVLSIYNQAMMRTIHNRKLLSEFKQLDLGTPEKPMPAMYTEQEFDKIKGRLTKDERYQYTEFDHPSLQGYKVHSNLKDILNDHFEISREGGLNDFAEGLLSLNNALKRVFVFGSLFHASALFMSAVYSLGISGAVKGMFGKGKLGANHSWKDLELGTGSMTTVMQEAIKDGLEIGNVKRKELVNPGKVELDEFLDKLGEPGVLGQKAFGKLDEITWEYMHDRFKVASHLRHKEILMRKGMDEVTAGKKAAEFGNDAFGSLNWNDFATRLYDYAYRNPGKLRGKIATKTAQMLPVNKRRWLNLGLFAPDWTISNIRIVGRTFWNAPKVTKAFVNRVHTGKWGKDEKEFIQAWNMYAAYSARAGFYTSILWWQMTELFSDEEPTMEALGEFWSGETSGKLQLGGGESMVISKQIAEPIHWVQHPSHTLLNKMSVVPKTVMEGFFNKQWFSMKKGFPMGPAIVEQNGEAHYGKWVLGKFIPIVAKPIIADDLEWQERFERVFTGFFGFPQYGKPKD